MERIVEFYASTEGNVNMVNNTGKVGAVGVIPWFTEWLYPILLLRIDPREPSRCSLRILLFLDSNASGWRCVPFGLCPFVRFFLNAVRSRLTSLTNKFACILLQTSEHKTAWSG